MKPCLAYTKNSIWIQLLHVLSELLEVVTALVKGDHAHAAEELADVQVGCETALYILGYHAEDERNHIRDMVDCKNARRGYHGRRQNERV